jgi:hypothetical protein
MCFANFLEIALGGRSKIFPFSTTYPECPILLAQLDVGHRDVDHRVELLPRHVQHRVTEEIEQRVVHQV